MQKRQHWNSSLGFILASAGSAIGLGAIWKFPYIAGQYGGGAFLIEFIIFTLLIGLPLLIVEFCIGHTGKTYSMTIFEKLTGSRFMNLIGLWGNIAAFILYAFYSVIGGWIIIFIGYYLGVIFNLFELQLNYFQDMIANPILSILGALLFIIFTEVIVSFGIQNGIEKYSKIMMPLLFILFLIIVLRALLLDGSNVGLKYFLIPRFEDLSLEGTLYAMGQSFFALSLGTTGMITYASYTKDDTNVIQSALWIVMMNLLISILAGLAIFPAASALNIEVESGPGLLFLVLPQLFDKMTFGFVFYLLFLILFLFAALTSSISLLELILSNLIKNNENKRKKYAFLLSLAIFFTSVPAALSFGIFKDIQFGVGTIFDNMDFLVSNIMMPLGVLFTTLFCGFVLNKQLLLPFFTTRNKHPWLFSLWYALIKYILPIIIIIVFITQLI